RRGPAVDRDRLQGGQHFGVTILLVLEPTAVAIGKRLRHESVLSESGGLHPLASARSPRAAIYPGGRSIARDQALGPPGPSWLAIQPGHSSSRSIPCSPRR